jgi:hypothetical protein
VNASRSSIAPESRGRNHGHEEKRKISLREFQMLLRNRSGEGFVGCNERSQSTLYMRAGYEKDVLTAFAGLRPPVRFETRSSRDVRANSLRCFFTPRSHRNQRELRGGSFMSSVALLRSVTMTIEAEQNCVEIKKRRSHDPRICPHPCDVSIRPSTRALQA